MTKHIRHHVIPTFLQRRFASRIEKEKAWIYQYKKSGEIREMSVKDTAVVNKFFFAEENIDPILSQSEGDLAAILSSIDQGRDVSEYGELIGRNVWLLAFRAASCRQAVKNAMTTLIETISSGDFNRFKPAIRKKLNLEIEKIVEDHLGIKHGEITKFLRKNEINALKIKVKKELTRSNLNFMGSIIKLALDDGYIKNMIKSAHVSSVKKLGLSITMPEHLRLFKWKVVRIEADKLAISDSMVFALTNTDTVQPLFVSNDNLNKIFFPIDSNSYILGSTHDRNEFIPISFIKEGIAMTSQNLFLANSYDEDLDRFRNLIGRNCELLSGDTIEAMVEQSFWSSK